ncbi:MAG: DUF1015 domain-containing protein [Treponema sp.]|nr:DUF1015 domain-containing protein [Treponema sp.]
MNSNALSDFGIVMPDILLPASSIDRKKWAVIACDQFTQDMEYWERVGRFVGDAPSTLHLVFPEIYLEKAGVQERITRIHRTMRSYLEQDIFAPPLETFVYVERETPNRVRRGLVASIDLERYDWSGSALIRATEGTVPERLPPRMDVRRNAPLESPHVLLLINDRTDALLPALGRRAKAAAPLYRTELMMDSGAVTGWAVNKAEDVSLLVQNLESLAREGTRADGNGGTPFLFAVGDGNHSLAAAKSVWNEYKASHAGTCGGERLSQHPSRYALVEIENLYDPGVHFEPIHRVLSGEQVGNLLKTLSALPDFAATRVDDMKELSMLVAAFSEKNRLGLVLDNGLYMIEFANRGLAVVLVQPLLDGFVKETGASIDYVHDEDAVFRVTRRDAYHPAPHCAGLLLPPVQKRGLFETISQFGSLPRKSFSMGGSLEKRFYFECRKIEP